MVKKVKKSDLVGKIGKAGSRAMAAHASDEVDYGSGGDLPGGIEGGIAELVDCKFDKYKTGDNQGEYYFYAAGVVVSPAEFNGQHIAGLRTVCGPGGMPEPMCATPTRGRKTVEDHIAFVLNEFRKLGVDTEGMDENDLETTAEALKEEKPHFRFRTWQGQKQTEGEYKDREPRVNHEWRGACDYADEADPDAEVDDASEEVDDAEDVEQDQTLEELAELADAGDEEAGEKLAVLAAEQDIDPDDHPTWAGLAEALDDATPETNADEGGDDDEEADWLPEKGEIYGYKPPKGKKAVECEVTAVFEGKETCNLKNLDTGKPYKGVPWNKLGGE